MNEKIPFAVQRLFRITKEDFTRHLSVKDTLEHLIKEDKLKSFLSAKNLVQVQEINEGIVLLIENENGDLFSCPLYKDGSISLSGSPQKTFMSLILFLEKWNFVEWLTAYLSIQFPNSVFIPTFNNREIAGILANTRLNGGEGRSDAILKKSVASIIDALFCEDDMSVELPSEIFLRKFEEVISNNNLDNSSRFIDEYRLLKDTNCEKIDYRKLLKIGKEFYKKGESLCKEIWIDWDEPAPNIYSFLSQLDDIRIITKSFLTADEDFYKFSDEGLKYLKNDKYITSWCHDHNISIEEIIEKYYNEVQKIIAENNREE